MTRERVRQLQNIALSKMRKAMASHEHQRSIEEIELEEQVRARHEVIRDFMASKSAKSTEDAQRN